MRIDVTDASTIQAAKEVIEKAEGKLDALVNNAGGFNVFFFLTSKQFFCKSLLSEQPRIHSVTRMPLPFHLQLFVKY